MWGLAALQQLVADEDVEDEDFAARFQCSLANAGLHQVW